MLFVRGSRNLLGFALAHRLHVSDGEACLYCNRLVPHLADGEAHDGRAPCVSDVTSAYSNRLARIRGATKKRTTCAIDATPRRSRSTTNTYYNRRSPGASHVGTRFATPRRPIFSMACWAMCSRAVSFCALAEVGTKVSVAWEGVTPRHQTVAGGA